MKRLLLSAVVAVCVACGGGLTEGASTPGKSACERSCIAQENTCESSCRTVKETFQERCSSRCGDDNAQCLAGCSS